MQYMLLIHTDEAAMARTPPEDLGKMVADFGAYTEALKAAGAWVASDRLRPSSTATVVRIADGQTQVLDGPYAEAKEQLAGFYIVEAPDLDAAVSWAARCPGAAHGAMEVRPVWA
jgi:hypothetical protein